MIALAVEMSSARGSLAVFRDGDRLGTAAWDQGRRDGQALFREWPDLLARAGIAPREVGVYICGRGPGTFSGLRVALSAVRAAAVPTGARVYALSSGEALAAELFTSSDAATVAVIGDARRGRLWCGLFRRGRPAAPAWSLVAPEQLAGHARDADAWVSPQYSRLAGLLPEPARNHPAWIPGDRLPRAEVLGQAALARIREDQPGEPLTPLYLHPPVARPPLPTPDPRR